MLKKYRNGFVDIIRKHGLDSASFRMYGEWNDPVHSDVIRYLDSPLSFHVYEHPKNFDRFRVRLE